MMQKIQKIWLFIFILIAQQTAFSQEERYYELFQQANNLYKEGKYSEALKKYQSIVNADFTSPEIYYNLANTYYKLNQIPEAILYYEKALKIKPNDNDIRFNLEVAKKHTSDKINALPPVITTQIYNAILHLFSSDQWAWMAIFLMFLSAALFITYYIKKTRLFLTFSVIITGLSILSIIFSIEQKNQILNSKEGIVFTPVVTVKSEPNPTSTDLFVIHSGLKVKVLETSGDWIKISLEDGNIGWMKQSDIRYI